MSIRPPLVLLLALLAAPAAAQTRECGPLPAGAHTLACTCAPGAAGGAVWGSGPYTADSDICTAALHAGVIGPGGGEVTLRRLPGQSAYAATSANGVQTLGYGSYGESFDFGVKD